MKLTLDDYLSPHFTVGEFFRSGTAIRLGINNTPDAYPDEGISTEEVIENLRALCTEVLERAKLPTFLCLTQKQQCAMGTFWNSIRRCNNYC